MRRKIAKRWRKEILRRGAVIVREGIVFSPGERKAMGIPKGQQGYAVVVRFNGWTYHVADSHDALGAYKLFMECLDMEADDAGNVHKVPGR